MKRRLIALLLCFAMVLPILPANAAEEEFAVYHDGSSVSSVVLPQYDKVELTAEGEQTSGYQWQIHVSGDMWVDISGADSATLNLNYAMIHNLLSDGVATVRCVATRNGETVETNNVTVSVDPDAVPEFDTPEFVRPEASNEAQAVADAVISAPDASEEDVAEEEESVEEAQVDYEAAIAEAEADYDAASAEWDAAEAALKEAKATADAAETAAQEAEAAADTAAEAAALAAEAAEAEGATEEDIAAAETAAADAKTAEEAAATARAAADEAAAAVTAAEQRVADAEAAFYAADEALANIMQESGSMADVASYDLTSEADAGVDTADAGDDVSATTYSIVINYVFADGEQAASPWSATVAGGSNFTQIVTSPTVVGYAPNEATVELNYTAISANDTITVTYAPALVNYTVKHYQQNLNDDKYTLAGEDSKTGYTEDKVATDLANTYDGFYALLYDTDTKIAADGSTVVEIYYDRYYYLMTFDLDGGYGVEPIYARYGAPVSAGTPTKAGYTFAGWSPEFTYETMPAKNTNFTATWTSGNTTYDVVFWYENADDTNYSQAGVLENISANAGSVVNGSAYANANFTGRDATHFTYSHADENVTVKGDGSTVVNVYFSRNTYTLTFRIQSGRNYTTVKTITEKYEAKISHYFPIVGTNGTTYSGYQWEDSSKATYDYVLQTLDIMPGNDVTFNGSYRGTDCVIYYYVEIVSGESLEGDTTTTFNGKTYKLFKSVEHSFNYITYDEEYHPIEGFSRSRSNASPAFGTYNNNNQDSARLGDSGDGYDHVNYLYYDRESYTLTFSNVGTTVAGKGGTVQYEAPLASYDFTPDYPASLEPDAYVFEGWYESPFFGDTKVDFDTATMPANDLTLYARWVPKNHNVNIYLTSEMNAADKIGDTQVVAHRELAVEPVEPTNGKYIFVGWFYMDGETEKAFDFSMPVTKDLDLYAKWSSNTLMEYTIHYELADGTTIAPDTTGSALAGTTKTFEAKAGEELNEGYQSGYFPQTNSHSLTIDIEDPSKNEFTFIYVPKAEVPYIVKYLEYGTEKVLVEQKDAATRDAVITETFVPITGYMPDAYQKRLVLSADESQNVIIFWYAKDDTHAPVQIIHYVQNAVGDGYTVYQESSDLNGVINQTYSTNVLTITGYTYDHATANDDPVEAADGKVTGIVTESGLILELYYNRTLYPYEFKFLEQGTNKVLADPVTGTARYGSQVTQNAKPIAGYTLVSDEAQAITIAKEDGDTAVNNVRIFYYTEQDVIINYVPVGPNGANDGSGIVTPETETVKAVTGTAAGSVPTPSAAYKFVGWYEDEACTDPVDTEDGTVDAANKFVPAKVDGIYVADTYYAKFEYNLTTMKVTKKVVGTPYDSDDTFIFQITDSKGNVIANVTLKNGGSVTIKDVTVGETYTVVEKNTSNRYSAEKDSISVKIQVDASKNVAAFVNNIGETKWLTATSVEKNVFGN